MSGDPAEPKADHDVFEWDCAIGTPDEDHGWRYHGGDESVGVPGAWVCRACGKVDESDREPPSYDDDY